MTKSVAKPPLGEIQAARERLAPHIVRTPLIPLEHENAPAEIYLKLENLQPIGSFKLRGAGNAMAVLDPHRLQLGVYTASAGNMAQGVAWNARRLGARCQVVVPNDAPMAKLEAIARLRGEIIQVPYDEWWEVMMTHRYGDLEGHFIHPVSNKHVVAGNATIGLEIAEQLPDVDSVVAPFGGGGLSCGIAAAFEGLQKKVQVHAAEVDTAAPFAASLAAGEPVSINRTPSFVDGIGGQSMLPEMWPLASSLLSGSIQVSLRSVAQALRHLLERHHVVAEGAGAAAVAAALTGKAGTGKVVCVVSGGNIDKPVLSQIIAGRVPTI